MINLHIDRQEKYVLLQLQDARLDATNAPSLRQIATKESEPEEVCNIILDITAAKYIDSSGLSAILVVNRLCKDFLGKMILVGASEHVIKLIKISQLDKVLDMLPTVEEAIDDIFMSELQKEMGESEL